NPLGRKDRESGSEHLEHGPRRALVRLRARRGAPRPPRGPRATSGTATCCSRTLTTTRGAPTSAPRRTRPSPALLRRPRTSRRLRAAPEPWAQPLRPLGRAALRGLPPAPPPFDPPGLLADRVPFPLARPRALLDARLQVVDHQAVGNDPRARRPAP